MAIDTNSPAPVAPVPVSLRSPDPAQESVVVYQHSNLFYWWPIWAFGFLFAAISYFGDYHMAIVPGGAKAVSKQAYLDEKGVPQTRDVIVLPEKKDHLTRKNAEGQVEVVQPTVYVSQYRVLGTIYLFILLIVIFITNITLRGQWSLVLVITLTAISIIFWITHLWERIFDRLGNMSIYINLGGYMMIALVVFILWIANFFFFDRQLYAVFTPGRVRMCMEIGAGEITYDTIGMVVQKQRSDIFRHVILGFGSGDLVLRFPRTSHPIELHNVLGIKKVLRNIERMMQEKVVVAEGGPDSTPIGGPPTTAGNPPPKA